MTMKREINKLILVMKIFIAYLQGRYRLFLKMRRSRNDWPKYDNAYLWYGEEAYEFNHSGTDDEYMDVLGTIMILQFFPNYDFHNRIRRFITITRPKFKIAFLNWWLRQHRRGRPNLSIRATYSHFRRIHSELKKQGINNK